MKNRWMLCLAALFLVVESSGCCCHCSKQWFGRQFWCNDCGEQYYSEWFNDPPACCDPCNECGAYIGKGKGCCPDGGCRSAGCTVPYERPILSRMFGGGCGCGACGGGGGCGGGCSGGCDGGCDSCGDGAPMVAHGGGGCGCGH